MPLNTFLELLERSRSLYPDRDAFRIRTRDAYSSKRFTDLSDDVMNLAAALESLGLSRQHIAVIGENSYEWVVTYLATVVSGGTIVPIDKELSLPEIRTIVTQSESRALFCSDEYSEEVADELNGKIADELVNPTVTGLPITCFVTNVGEHARYTTLQQLIASGAELRKSNSTLGQNESQDHLTTNLENRAASIVFTSGTTGFSKGVMLSRRNLLSNVESADEFIKLGNCVLSVLPMHHTYEFTLDILFSIYQGRAIAINNSIKYFAQNIKLFAPSDLLIVPLVTQNMLKNIWQNARSQGKEAKLRKALKLSRLLMKMGIDIRRIIFKDIHAGLGGNLREFFIGGALVDLETAYGFHDFGFKVNIGYGITECSPLVTGKTSKRRSTLNTCGVTIPEVDIRIQNPNDIGEGEVQVRGPNVMLGYFKNREATAAAFDDGWFRTGDIGVLDRGNLRITGRIKNLIILKNGKNIHPEELESRIETIPQVKEIIVRGSEAANGEEITLIAEIFPDLENYPTPEAAIRSAVHDINETLPYYKRIVEVIIREKEFPKTTSKKIKRY